MICNLNLFHSPTKIITLGLILFSFQNLSAQSNWVVEKLPETINSAFDEITPVPSRDGKALYFTRVGYPEFERTLIFDTIDYAQKLKESEYLKMLGGLYAELGQTYRSDPTRSAFNQDVWMSQADSAGAFYTVAHPGYPLNNALTNSLVAITPDPNAFYIVNQFKPEGDMKRGFSIIRRQNDSTWQFPQPVNIADYYTITSDVNLTMSFDGQVLILSAARFDSRSLDLYICFKEGENKWSAPKHLGNVINSDRREMTPYLSENNRTLYFASDRESGVGGLDIYMTRREDDTWFNWSSPIQLIEPINSRADESQPYFNMTTGYLYFTSKRDGNSDIYRVSIAPPQPTEIVVKGRIINTRTRQLMTNSAVEYFFDGSERQVFLAEDGTFTLKIPKGVHVKFNGLKPGFTGNNEDVYFRQDYYYFKDYYTFDLLMGPLEKGSKITLPPIYFQQSKAEILENSYGALESLAGLLTENPGMSIKIDGYTDNIGKAEDLIQLFEARANAIRNYLTEKGVSPERVETEGRGPADPINDNSTDELRQQNRRVEIHVTKI